MTYAAAKQGVRSTVAVVIGVAVFGLAGGEAVAAEGGFESLFDGAIVCHGPRSHLFYVGPDAARPVEFRDFHLRAEIMTRPGSNSGVFFHTALQDEGWPQQGYEVQVNNTQRDPVRTGSIYNVVKNFTPPAKDDEWFLLEVVVKGKTVRVSVDERVLFEFVEPEGVTGTRRLSRGLVALQGHDPDSEVHYRRVEIKPLD